MDSAPLSDVRSVRQLWSQASADRTRAARSQALLGTVLAFPCFVNAAEAPQKPHAEQSLWDAVWKARGLERGRGAGAAARASSGAWELLLASPDMSAPPVCLGTSRDKTHSHQAAGPPCTERGLGSQGCQSDVPARCAPGVPSTHRSALGHPQTSPRPRVRTFVVPILPMR